MKKFVFGMSILLMIPTLAMDRSVKKKVPSIRSKRNRDESGIHEDAQPIIIRHMGKDLRFTSYQELLDKQPNLSFLWRIPIILKKHPDVLIASDSNGNNILMWALAIGDKKRSNKLFNETKFDSLIDTLIHNGVNLNGENSSGDFPLLHVIKKNQYKLVEKFIEAGAELNKTNSRGLTPLIVSLESERRAKVSRYLLSKNVSINASFDTNGNNALMISLVHRSPLVSDVLRKTSDNISTINKHGQNALILAAIKGLDEIVVEILKNKNINLDTQDNKGNSALFYASGAGGTSFNERIIRKLINAGASLQLKNNNNETVAHYWSRHLSVGLFISFMKQIRPTINLKDNLGNTPLYYAFQDGFVEVAQMLLDNDAQVVIQNNNGLAPIHVCKDSNQLRQLINNGAQLDLSDNAGNTVWSNALKSDNYEIVRYCIQKKGYSNILFPGALSTTIKNESPRTASLLFDNGFRLSQDEMKEELKDTQTFTEYIMGQRDRETYYDKRTAITQALWYAVMRGNSNMAQYCLANGADPHYEPFAPEGSQGPRRFKERALPSHSFKQSSPNYENSAYMIALASNDAEMKALFKGCSPKS